MAAGDATQVIGGNWQVFDQFIKRANATLHLNTAVSALCVAINIARDLTDCTVTRSPQSTRKTQTNTCCIPPPPSQVGQPQTGIVR